MQLQLRLLMQASVPSVRGMPYCLQIRLVVVVLVRVLRLNDRLHRRRYLGGIWYSGLQVSRLGADEAATDWHKMKRFSVHRICVPFNSESSLCTRYFGPRREREREDQHFSFCSLY